MYKYKIYQFTHCLSGTLSLFLDKFDLLIPFLKSEFTNSSPIFSYQHFIDFYINYVHVHVHVYICTCLQY